MSNCNDLFLLVVVAIGIYFVMKNPEKGSKVSVKPQAGGGDIDKIILKGVKQGLGIPILLALFASAGFVIWTWTKDGVWWPWDGPPGSSSGEPVPGGIGVVSEITKEVGKVFIPSNVKYAAEGTTDEKSMMVSLKLKSGSKPEDMVFDKLVASDNSSPYILVNDVFTKGKLKVGDTHLLVYSTTGKIEVTYNAAVGTTTYPTKKMPGVAGAASTSQGVTIQSLSQAHPCTKVDITNIVGHNVVSATGANQLTVPGATLEHVKYDQRVVKNIYIHSSHYTESDKNQHNAKLLLPAPCGESAGGAGENDCFASSGGDINYRGIQQGMVDVQMIIEYDKPLSVKLFGVGAVTNTTAGGLVSKGKQGENAYLNTHADGTGGGGGITSIKLLKLN